MITTTSLVKRVFLPCLCISGFLSDVNAQLDQFLFRHGNNRKAAKPPRLGSISFRLRENEETRQYRASNLYASNSFNGLPSLPPSSNAKEWHADESVFLSSANIRRRNNSWFGGKLDTMTGKLIAANLLVFALQVINPSITRWGAKLSAPILRGRQLHRLVTPIFLHGGLSHLAINTASLMNIGPQVESVMGKNRFLATYLASGAVGNLISSVFTPNPSVGASGAIFGLVGAYYTFLRTNKSFFGSSGERGRRALQQTLATNLVYGLVSPSIDNWGHLGGAIGGAAVAYAFGPRLFVVRSPDGRAILVDKPVVTLPKSLESVPQSLKVQLQRLKRKLQVDRFTADLSLRSWQRKDRSRRRR